MSGPESPGWEVLGSEEICRTPYLQVLKEHVATPSRPGGVYWSVVKRPTAAVVAPRTAEGKYVLVKQERVAIRRALWEFPAGQVDGSVTEGSIRETAARELGEEAGLECKGEYVPLGLFFPSAGFTDECSHLFLATEVQSRPGGASHDEHEAILEVRAFSPEELREMIAAGQIIDANTLATYARLQARRLI